MSDDLVNRLRREAGMLATMYAAADEIERLRGALRVYEQGRSINNQKNVMGCPVCGLGSDGKPMAYACARNDCPTRATCIVGNT